MSIAPLRKKFLGDVLLVNNFVTRENLKLALEEQQQTKEKLGTILVKHGFITETALLKALAISSGLPYVRLADEKVDKEIFKIVGEKLARRYTVIPISKKENVIRVAMADPSNVVAIDEIEKETNCKLSIVLADEKEIKELIETSYAGELIGTNDLQDNAVEDISKEDEALMQEDVEGADAAPVIKYVNGLLFEAVTKKASDIHIEPEEMGVSLRMRLDGELRECPPPPPKFFSAIISRIKIMANLDISERRLPQDGKCKIKVNDKKIDVRVSTLPTIYGEKVVMRVLDRSSLSLSIDAMGLNVNDATKFKDALDSPYGMILVTGPTGSGKTTTLYTGLNYINSPEKNIVTAEDPVEYELRKVNQVQVRGNIGLTFANILRSVLRQDPDVIMVGEIRDRETAEIAIQSALTGHLVLSTLHTNDAVSSLSRMRYMGIEPFLIADAVELVMAQRLVRRICPACKEEHTIPPNLLARLKLAQGDKIIFYHGRGCDKCYGTGYAGRAAIMETLFLSPTIKNMIIEDVGDVLIKEQALKEGMRTLRDAAIEKLRDGITTVEEVLSVTASQ